ncbi:MAG: hypothetical protein SPH18_07170 [Sutterella parvirubra]|nr:hypothetical protein [Sutterella parvirubra]
MSLSSQIASLATTVGADVKGILASIGTLSELTTTQKANLVVALNELKAGLTGLESELGAQINDEATASTTTWSSQKINTAISTAVSDLINGAPGTLDTLKELADAITENQGAIEALETIAAGHVKYDGAQSLTTEQQAQARTNIGAASQSDLSAVSSTATVAQSAASTNAANIGTLTSLTTTAKGNLVAAINEVKTTATSASTAASQVASDLAAFKTAVGDTAANFAQTYTTARDSKN